MRWSSANCAGSSIYRIKMFSPDVWNDQMKGLYCHYNISHLIIIMIIIIMAMVNVDTIAAYSGHRRRSSVNFRGRETFLREKCVWKINKMAEFYMIFARKMPELHNNCPTNILSRFFGPSAPVPYAYDSGGPEAKVGTFVHSLHEPGELSQWLCRDDSMFWIVLDCSRFFYYQFKWNNPWAYL